MMEYLYCDTCFSLRTLLIMPVALGDRSFSRFEVINLLKTKRRLLNLKPQSLPRSKHFSSRL